MSTLLSSQNRHRRQKWWHMFDVYETAFALAVDNGVRGVASMTRRRTSTHYKPISISLPIAMIVDIEDKLNEKESRSQWIAAAIEAKLDGDGWSLVRDGNANHWFNAFKRAMTDHGVHIDTMFWNIIEQNCADAVKRQQNEE